MNKISFGKFIQIRRIDLKMTLREFSRRFGYDPAYISRIETEKLSAPQDQQKLEALALALGFSKGSVEWIKFFDLAYESRQELPQDIKSNASEVISRLPAFLRTADNKKINKEKVKKLLDFLIDGKK